MVATLIRLRWRLTLNALKKNVWALIGTILGGLYALGLIPLLLVGAVALSRASTEVIANVLAVFGAFMILGWTLIPLLLTGVDTTLDPRAMAAWTAPSARLARGLAVAGATGLPGIVTAFALLLPALTWLAAGEPLAAGLALLMGPVALATCVLTGRVVVIGAGVSTTRRGRDMVGIIAVILVVFGSLAPSIVNVFAVSAMHDGGPHIPVLGEIARVVGLTPFGWATAAPGYLAQGQALPALGLAVGAVAIPLALLPLWERVVTRVMTTPAHAGGSSHAYKTRRGPRTTAEGRDQVGAGDGAAGLPEVLPWQRRLARLLPGPSAAVAARCLRYWRADPRYLVLALTILIVPLVVLGSAATGSMTSRVGSPGAAGALALGHAPWWLLFVGLFTALMTGWAVHDDLAFDSTAVWTHISAAVPGRYDLLGRALAAALWQVPLVIAVELGVGAWTGRWDMVPAFLGTAAAIYGSALAWSALTCVIFPYEVNAPGESPLKSRTSGMALLAAVVQMIGMLAIVVIALPAAVALVALAITGAWGWGWLLLPAGIAWGCTAAWIGARLGGRLLDGRSVAILTTIRSWSGHEETR